MDAVEHQQGLLVCAPHAHQLRPQHGQRCGAAAAGIVERPDLYGDELDAAQGGGGRAEGEVGGGEGVAEVERVRRGRRIGGCGAVEERVCGSGGDGEESEGDGQCEGD